MDFNALGPVQHLRQLAAGVEQILTRMLVATATPILRAVIGADSHAPGTADAGTPTASTTAKPTHDSRPLRVIDGPASGVVDAADVRAWARGRGLQVGDRGRISRTVIDEYLTAHAS